jgi:hypothetical protein
MFIMTLKLVWSFQKAPTRFGLMRSGTMVAAVTIYITSVHDFKGITPKFVHLNQAGDIEVLHALTVPNAEEVMNDSLLNFKGKTVMALPQFLTKMLMDVDSKDPFKLFQAVCKALNDFDESHLAIASSL